MFIVLIVASIFAVAVVALLAWAAFEIAARQDEADELAAKGDCDE